MTDELALLDATAQAELVRTGQVSAAELVTAAIERIEALNPVLNAVVTDDAEVYVEAVDPEPLQHPVIARQELAGVAVEVKRAEVERPAHGRASSTMLNGADSGATRRTRV